MQVHSLSSKHQQRGVVLVVSLIVLLLLTITGLASIQNSALQEKMAGNSHDYEQAFLAAETALRTGETYLIDNYSTINFATSGADGLYDRSADNAVAVEWQYNATIWRTITSIDSAVASSPKYFIEKLPDTTVSNTSLATDAEIETESMFRITAKGYGKTTLSRSVVTSTYKP